MPFESWSYSARVRNDRVYSAMRKTMVSVARERTTPRVIEPAIRTIVTINGGIGSTRVILQCFQAMGNLACYSVRTWG